MKQLIDTHSHIYLDQFESDVAEVIQRAKDENIGSIVLPNIDSNTIEPLHNITSEYPDYLFPLMGLHPTHVKENYLQELEKIQVQFEKFNYIGIGEIGIDLYWDKTFYEEQKYVFEQQLLLATRKNLPVVIHARESFTDILQIVKKNKYKELRGIFHAFTGDNSLAKEIIELGYKIGIGGILTFKNSGLDETVRSIDINHIVVETDSPYLAPVPFRGKRNESSYLKFIVEKLAEIKKLSIAEVTEITTKNANSIFEF
jgi:TatD DNase family protein